MSRGDIGPSFNVAACASPIVIWRGKHLLHCEEAIVWAGARSYGEQPILVFFWQRSAEFDLFCCKQLGANSVDLVGVPEGWTGTEQGQFGVLRTELCK